VATERQRQVVFADAVAVITNAQQLNATLLSININMLSTGIQRIFDQLFNDIGWTFYNFARGNLVRKTWR
jgi:hypothetical protein